MGLVVNPPTPCLFGKHPSLQVVCAGCAGEQAPCGCQVRHQRGTGLSLCLPAASLLRGTHPAHAARRARAPAASTPHAPGHHSPRHTTGARLAQPWTCLWPPRAALHTGARAPRSGGLHTGRPTTDTSTPPGRKTTNNDDARRRKDAACPQGHKAGVWELELPPPRFRLNTR